jgi:hypothetical protein
MAAEAAPQVVVVHCGCRCPAGQAKRQNGLRLWLQPDQHPLQQRGRQLQQRRRSHRGVCAAHVCVVCACVRAGAACGGARVEDVSWGHCCRSTALGTTNTHAQHTALCQQQTVAPRNGHALRGGLVAGAAGWAGERGHPGCVDYLFVAGVGVLLLHSPLLARAAAE